MQFTFLCPVHREWVYFHSQTALSYLDNVQEKGEAFMQADDWQQALPFLGCAFETTEILLEVQGAEKTFLLGRLTSLSILLAKIFNQLGRNNYGQIILEQAENRLQDVATISLGHKLRLSYVQQCIVAIRTCIKQHELASTQVLGNATSH